MLYFASGSGRSWKCAASGFVPVVLSPDGCNGCNLCVDACPEPYGLVTADTAGRLDALPHARFCIEAKEKEEDAKRR